jgi:hypothetical protein
MNETPNSMVQNLLSTVDRYTAGQDIFRFKKTESSSPCLKKLPLDSILGQFNPVHIFTHYILKIHFQYTRVYPKVSGLAAWSENCKRYSSLPVNAVISLFCESV